MTPRTSGGPPTPFAFLHSLLRQTPWQFFAAVTALYTVIVGAGFFYPNVYTLSRSYTALQHLFPNPHVLGILAMFFGVMTFVLLPRQRVVWPLAGVLAILLLLTFASFLAVHITGGTVVYAVWAAKAMYALLRSGGFRRRGP